MTAAVKPKADEHYIRPEAAARKLKLAAEYRKIVWCRGVSGMGKTSLIADYLKRKRYSYFSAESVRPEELPEIENTGKTSIVVIDDFYGIEEPELQSGWLEWIRIMADRQDVWLIILSRAIVPSWLYSVSLSQSFCMIEERDFHLTEEQTKQYFSSWGLSVSEEMLHRIWNKDNGIPLWIRVCADILQQETDEDRVIEIAAIRLWKHLSAHVYDQWPSDISEAMMKLSLFPEFDLDMAVCLTGNGNVNLLLNRALELGSFLELKDGMWSIRKFMRTSMLERLEGTCSEDYRRRLYSRAGDSYRIKNRFPEALDMYEKARDNQNIADLLIQNARENPSTGRYYEMRYFYLRLPEESIRQSVELMGAMSMLQSMLMNEEESERWYQELKNYAAEHTGRLKREAANKMLYLDIALPHRGTKNMVVVLTKAAALLMDRSAQLPEFSVTSNLPSQMNGGKDFCEWSKKDKELAATIGKIVMVVLGKYGKGLISLALAESGFEKENDNYEVESLAVRGRMEAEGGGKLGQCFVAAGIMTWLAVFTDHMENASATLDGFYEMMREHQGAPQMERNLLAMKCRLALYEGRTAEIQEWMQEAPREREEFCGMERFRYLTKVRVYLACQKYEEAGILLQKLEYYAVKMKRTYISIETGLLQAILFYRQGKEEWREKLQEVIARAEEYHFVRLLSREGAALLPLLRKEKFQWKDDGFRRQTERETAYMAKLYPDYMKKSADQAETLVLSGNAREILRLQAMGKSIAQIAEILHISTATVKYHNRETYKKLGVQTNTQAVSEARIRNLI